LVARFVRVEEVGGSNPLSPTLFNSQSSADWLFFLPCFGQVASCNEHSLPLLKGGCLIAPRQVRQTLAEYNLKWTRFDLLALGVILLCALGLVWQLWAPGVQSRVDMLIGVYRIFELAAAWREGIWYPRLGPDLNFTYGAPMFQFYPPLVSYVGLAFYGLGLGWISAAKASLAISLPLAGAGMYFYARLLFADRCAAWLSAMLYVTAPYLLLDMYERGASAEMLALAVLPWLFWAMRRLLDTGDRATVCLSALLVAALMLAHNITMLFVLPALLGYLMLVALFQWRLGALGPVAVAVALGLGLCAFYWLPAVVEVQSTHAEEFMLGAGQIVTQGLLHWRDLFQDSWLATYVGPLRFRFALRPLIFGLLGVLALPFLGRRVRNELGVLALLWLVVMFLQTEFSLWFWQHLPLVRFIQFTWRLYGLASLAIVLLVGGLVLALRMSNAARWAVAGVLVVLAFWSSSQGLNEDLFEGWYDIDEAQIGLVDLFERGRDGFPLFSDYQPLAMTTSAMMMTLPQPADSQRFPPASPPPRIQVMGENFARIELAVDAPQPFTLRASRIYFPGWQIYADGRPLPTTPSGKLGLVTAEMPAGTYTASIQFDQTPLRRFSDLMSILALSALIGVGAGGSARRRWLQGAVAAVLLLALIFALQGPLKRLRTPTPLTANVQDTLHLLGYELDKTTWQPGELVTLRLYWFVEQAPLQDYKIFLHVTELDDSGKVTQLDTLPMFNFSSTTRWESGQLKVDQLRLPLEPEIKPGRYRLVLGLYPVDAVQNLTISDSANLLPGDRLALTEVEITNE
jgi:hypothetical protein